MEPRSYRASDAEWTGIKAEQEKHERDRQASMTLNERVMEGLVGEELRLVRDLERLRSAAARIPDVEFLLMKHREKIERFKAREGM